MRMDITDMQGLQRSLFETGPKVPADRKPSRFAPYLELFRSESGGGVNHGAVRNYLARQAEAASNYIANAWDTVRYNTSGIPRDAKRRNALKLATASLLGALSYAPNISASQSRDAPPPAPPAAGQDQPPADGQQPATVAQRVPGYRCDNVPAKMTGREIGSLKDEMTGREIGSLKDEMTRGENSTFRFAPFVVKILDKPDENLYVDCLISGRRKLLRINPNGPESQKYTLELVGTNDEAYWQHVREKAKKGLTDLAATDFRINLGTEGKNVDVSISKYVSRHPLRSKTDNKIYDYSVHFVIDGKWKFNVGVNSSDLSLTYLWGRPTDIPIPERMRLEEIARTLVRVFRDSNYHSILFGQ